MLKEVLIIIFVPTPGVESILIIPRSFVTFVLTTSIPTPRPEMFVTTSAVENPGKKNQI